MIVPVQSIAAASVLRADLCIIGGGPAGLTAAMRAAERGLSVIVLESGGERPTTHSQRAGRGEVVGFDSWPLHRVRHRGLGGSGQHWGGMCRPLDPEDFRDSEWVPRSGWPIAYEEFAQYVPEAYKALGLPDHLGLERPQPPLDANFLERAGVDLVVYGLSPQRFTFAEHALPRFRDDRQLIVILDAAVTDLNLAPSSAYVDSVQVARGDRTTFRVHAREFVLAAGGIENARILLNARSDRLQGLGNEHDLVGRYFMDHIHAEVGHVLLDNNSASRSIFEALDHSAGHQLVGPALAGNSATKQNRRLLAAAFTLTHAPHRFAHPFLSVPATLNHAFDDVRRAEVLHHLSDRPKVPLPRESPLVRDLLRAHWRLRAAAFLPTRRRLERLGRDAGMQVTQIRSLYVRSEQAPNRDSRVSLGTRKDRFGQPEPVLDWKVTEADTDSVESWADLLASAVTSELGVMLVRDPDWRSSIVGGPHHMGTTRMSNDPHQGVVDANARVHSVHNLHVAGSSIFASGGYANPTLSLVALALRLADRIATQVSGTVPISVTLPEAPTS